jgi:hypothetical protein
MWVYAKSRGDLRTFVGTPPFPLEITRRAATPVSELDELFHGTLGPL